MTTAAPKVEGLWLRKVSLLLLPELDQRSLDAQADATQNALDLSEMRIVFQTTSADSINPNSAVIRVYNLSDATLNRVETKEFSRVVLQAGYAQQLFGVIFKGDVTRYGIGKENAVDSYLDIFAMDGDFAANFATINQPFAAGSTPKDVINAAAAAMRSEISHRPDFTGFNAQYARGKVMFGMARDVMTNVSTTAGCTWSVQNGKVQILPLTGYLPGDAVVINSETGMVGIPVQTDQGVQVRCLINPRIRIGGLIQINEKDVQRVFGQPNRVFPNAVDGFTSAGQFNLVPAAKVPRGDGLYRVYVAEYSGDTRGNPWYMDMVCLAVDRSSQQVIARN